MWMLKLIFTIMSLLVLGQAYAGNLIAFERFESRDVIRSQNPIKSVSFSSGTRHKNFYSNYEGAAIMKVQLPKDDGGTYEKEITIWFDDQEQANDFVSTMHDNPNLNLMYDFQNNPLNGTSRYENCNQILTFICSTVEATIVVYHNIDANKLYINNPDTNTVVKANKYVENYQDSRDSSNDSLWGFNGPRDESREQDSELNQESQDSTRATAV